MLSFKLGPVSLQFHEAWKKLIDWLEDAENHLDSELEISNDPDKIKLQLSKHKVELCQSKAGCGRWLEGCFVRRGSRATSPLPSGQGKGIVHAYHCYGKRSAGDLHEHPVSSESQGQAF